MPDRFYLSLWLKDYDEAQMLERFRVLLDAFPYSRSSPRIRSFRICPLSWSEPLVVDEDFTGEGADIEYVLALAREHLHGDYAYEATAAWDLWVFQKNGGPAAWKQAPRPVRLICSGPQFEEGRAEEGHLQIDFGLDTPFRADQSAPDTEARAMARDYRERLRQLLPTLGFRVKG